MKKKEKEKRPYSALSNFWYTLKILFKTNAWHPIFEILATLTSLGVAVWVTYENKFFLDALETRDSTNRILLAMAGIVGVTMALRLISLAFNHLRALSVAITHGGSCTDVRSTRFAGRITTSWSRPNIKIFIRNM